MKMGRKTYEHLLFSFMRPCSKSPSCNRIPQLFLQPQSFFKKKAIIIGTHGQEALHGQLRKVILSDMKSCNFEAVN